MGWGAFGLLLLGAVVSIFLERLWAGLQKNRNTLYILRSARKSAAVLHANVITINVRLKAALSYYSSGAGGDHPLSGAFPSETNNCIAALIELAREMDRCLQKIDWEQNERRRDRYRSDIELVRQAKEKMSEVQGWFKRGFWNDIYITAEYLPSAPHLSAQVDRQCREAHDYLDWCGTVFLPFLQKFSTALILYAGEEKSPSSPIGDDAQIYP